MASGDSAKSAQMSKEALDVISNRVAIALAKHDNLVKSWTALSGRPKKNEKTQEELEAEDIALFRKAPPYLGVGAPIPSHFLVSDAERNNKSLRAKFFPTKGFKGSKPRDEEEKAASAKRGKVEESSDEEGGRSSLGKAKKRKKNTDLPSREAEVEKQPVVKAREVPAVLSKAKAETTTEVMPSKEAKPPNVPDQDNAPILNEALPKSAEQRRKEKKRLKKLLKKQEKKHKNKSLAEAV